MNYAQFFANGGKVDTKTIKSEIGRIFQIDDENKINALWQNAVQEYGSDENVLNALLTEIGDNTSDESIQSAMMKVLNYTPMEESQIFKCGGKLQQLVTKFRKGGPVDCGCGGIKLNQRGGVTGPFNNVPDRYYNENGVFLGYGNDPRIMDYINSRGNDRTWTVARSNGIANTTNQSRMLWNPEALPEPYDVNSFTRLADGTVTTLRQQPSINRSNYVETKQEGGTVELTQLPGHDVNTTLTRRQARQLAMDKGRYANNAQFQTAMANAMNAARSMGLRGAEARQRAMEMVAGVSPAERNIAAQNTLNTAPINTPVSITASDQILPETQLLLESMLRDTNQNITRSLQGTGTRIKNTSKDQVASRDRTGLTMTPGTTGVNMDQVALDEANRRFEERQRAYQESQLRARGMHFPRVDSSLEEGIFTIPVSQPTQGTGVLMPLTGNEAKMAQTVYGVSPKPVTRNKNDVVAVAKKQGGQIEKDITKTLKCGGKTKKK